MGGGREGGRDQMGAGALWVSGWNWNFAGKKRRRGCGVFIQLFLLPFSLVISPLSPLYIDGTALFWSDSVDLVLCLDPNP